MPLDPVYSAIRGGSLGTDVRIDGAARVVTRSGRSGIHLLGLRSRIVIPHPAHTVNRNEGSCSFWLMPMEDLANAVHWGHFKEIEPDFGCHVLLSDHPDPRDVSEANFGLVWNTTWWRQLMARFVKGAKPILPIHKPSFGPCDFHLRALRWYQILLTWDRPEHDFRMYANGILVATSNRGVRLEPDECGPSLYAGNTNFAVGEIAFYDRAMDPAMAEACYAAQAGEARDPEVMDDLRRTHRGDLQPDWSWAPTEDYRLELDVPFTGGDDLKHFYVQGNRQAPTITAEGLEITTPNEFPPPLLAPDNDDRIQVYLHSWKVFEGDIAVELEFKPLKEKGLALLMVHSSGMQREDFMKEYPLRTIGSMRMVCWENVRNYHWEFWREMEGIRPDVATHAFFKNPWFRGLAYQALPYRHEADAWHRLQLVQEGRRFRGGIDGKLVFDVADDPFNNNGPVFNCGHVSLRNMWNTRMLWRNLKVRVKKPPFSARTLASPGTASEGSAS